MSSVSSSGIGTPQSLLISSFWLVQEFPASFARNSKMCLASEYDRTHLSNLNWAWSDWSATAGFLVYLHGQCLRVAMTRETPTSMSDLAVKRPSDGRIYGLNPPPPNLWDYSTHESKYRRNALGLRSKESSLIYSKIYDKAFIHLGLKVCAENGCILFLVPCSNLVEIQSHNITSNFISYWGSPVFFSLFISFLLRFKSL